MEPLNTENLNQATANDWRLGATRLYEKFLIVMVAFVPSLAIAYIYFFQNPKLLFVAHGFHEVAIAAAILQSLFIAYVTWRCYLSSGEPLLRWLSLSLLAFSIVYLPHGILTRISDQSMALFLLYGPASRLIMVALLLVGLRAYGNSHDLLKKRTQFNSWLAWIIIFLLLDILISVVTLTLTNTIHTIRIVTEGGALLLSLIGVTLILRGHFKSSLMNLYAISLAYFAQSSLVFFLAEPWNHLWWLGHFIFASGFAVLSYGVLRAFHTTRAFSLVFNQEAVVQQLASAKQDAEKITEQLQEDNENLAVLATTDPLTGLNNRRYFMTQGQIEISRSQRANTSFTMLLLDLDFFKNINDQHGHAIGDEMLKKFATVVTQQLRPSDHISRWGGEEFMVLLADTSGSTARVIAERIRNAVEHMKVMSSGNAISVTVSIGLAEFPIDGEELEQLFEVVDQRLYLAKSKGRNQVVDRSS